MYFARRRWRSRDGVSRTHDVENGETRITGWLRRRNRRLGGNREPDIRGGIRPGAGAVLRERAADRCVRERWFKLRAFQRRDRSDRVRRPEHGTGHHPSDPEPSRHQRDLSAGSAVFYWGPHASDAERYDNPRLCSRPEPELPDERWLQDTLATTRDFREPTAGDSAHVPAQPGPSYNQYVLRDRAHSGSAGQRHPLWIQLDRQQRGGDRVRYLWLLRTRGGHV